MNGSVLSTLPRIQLLVFLGVFAVTAASAPGGLESGDAGLRFETAKSWLDGTQGALPPGVLGVRGKDGRSYAYYGLTQSVVLASFLAPLRLLHLSRADLLAKFVYSVLFLPLIFGLLSVVLLQALDAAGAPVVTLLRAVLCLLLLTPLLTYARSGQEENLLALAYALLLLGVVRVAQGSALGWLLLGGASAFALATRLASAPTIILTFVAVFPEVRRDLRERRSRNWVALGVLMVAGAVTAYAYWNWVRFGSPLESGYRFGFARLGVPIFDFSGWPVHTAALLVSPRRGILMYAPILVALFLRGRRSSLGGTLLGRLSAFGAAAWVVNLLFFSLSGTWDGGFGWGPRYLVAPLVFLAPLFTSLRWSSWSVRVLMIISALVQAGSIVLPSSTEDFVAAVQQGRGQKCDTWTLDCSGIWLRPSLAADAVRTTITSRELPTLDEARSGTAEDVLPTSDFRAAYWWPVRIAYRLHFGSPRTGLGVSLAGMIIGLWLLRRSLVEAHVMAAGPAAERAGALSP